MDKRRKRITCPYCGYAMPVYYTEKACSSGIFVRCKGRNCRKIFEIRLSVR